MIIGASASYHMHLYISWSLYSWYYGPGYNDGEFDYNVEQHLTWYISNEQLKLVTMFCYDLQNILKSS